MTKSHFRHLILSVTLACAGIVNSQAQAPAAKADSIIVVADTAQIPAVESPYVTPDVAPAFAKTVEYIDTVNGYPVNRAGKIVIATINPELLKERVIVGNDTVPIVLPARNYGRYDRGLFNFLFIP